jgi:hypothetical protein
MLIPNKHNGYTRDGVRRVFFDGGGGGTTRTETTNIPSYAEPAFMELAGKATALSEAPYQAYGGERVAQFTPLQRQAFDQVANQRVASQIGAASGIAGAAGLQGLGTQYTPFQTGQFTSQAAQQYMDPYMQNVVGIAQREAQRQADIAGTQRGAEAVRRGAFGGSRQAIMEAEAQRNLSQQMGDIQARGLQDAFARAQDMFGREQQMLEQSRQFGADLGQRGLATALQGAQTLGQLGQQQFGQEMDIMGARERMGTTQQQQIQNILNQQYADFQAQRDFPYQQLGFLSDVLRGSGSSTRTIYGQPSPLQTAVGLGTTAAGFMRPSGSTSTFAAEGGEIRYADGGITALLGDNQLAQTAQNQEQSPMMQLAAAEEAQRRNMLRSAAPSEMPQESDMTEEELLAALQRAIQQGDETKARVIAELIEERKMPESGIAQVAPESLGDVPDGGIVGMNDGGAVAFRTGDEVRTAYTPRKTSGQRMTDDALQALADAYENMPDALPIQLAREGTRQTVDALGNVVEAVADTKALPMSSGYLSQRDRDEQAREARRAAARERELASKRVMTATPQAAAEPASPLAALMSTDITPSAGRDRKLLERQSPTSGGLERALAAKQAEDKAIADAGGNVATPGGAGGGAMGVEQIMSLMRQAGYDPKAAQADLLARQEQIARDRAEGVAADRAALDKMIAERGVYGQEQEERMKAELEGLTGKKDEAKNFALIQAGLSILSADPSRGALAAIGQGAIQGLGAYKGDIEKLEAKRDKINERTDRILDIRRQERMADDDKRLALQKEENRLKEANSRDMFELYKGFGVENRAVATAVTQQVISSREKELDRRDRAERLAQGSKTNPAQYRVLLTNEIGELLKRKESGIDWTPDDEIQLKQLRQERDGLRAYLSTSVGNAGTPGQNAPKIGEVQQGYRFKGGDPSNQANWEKVK